MPRFLSSLHPSRAPAFALQYALVLGMFWAAAACTPQFLPLPATETATTLPPTPTLPPLDAPVVESPALVAIRMFDENDGWGVGDSAIVRTINGGVTWHDVSPAPSQYGYSVTTEFIDSMHGWVLVPNPQDFLSGVLFRTADGGANWRESPVPFGGGAIRFLDGRNGWMMASLGAGAGSMAVAVYQTNDAGATWTRTYVNDPNEADADDSLPLGGLKNGITPVDLQQAWIGGVIYEPGRIYLYKTTDGGRTWNQSSVRVPKDYELAEVETPGPIFASSQVAYLPVHLSSQNGVMLAVYASQDGGTSWLTGPTFIPEGGSIDFVSPESGFAWNGTNFYLTRDASKTWIPVRPDVDFTDSFSGMDFVSPQVGFVLTDQGDRGRQLFVTHNAGATWSLVGH
jgi:photosystem II stability/assembly factor-like uncharacterized protein